jgi:hypothetical protein
VCERDTLIPIIKLQANHDLVAKGGSSNKKKQFVALVAKGIVMDRLQTRGELQDKQVLLIHQLVLIC